MIIAGFGRFGQVAGRLLISCGFEAIVLDNDPDPIETLRKFGAKVFYGDATRLDLLHAVGADQALVLINTVYDNLTPTRLAQKHFPFLKLVVRDPDMGHPRPQGPPSNTATQEASSEPLQRHGKSGAHGHDTGVHVPDGTGHP
ncbi:hypothetical protein CIB54_18075 [Pseudomonas fluorescens]|uniref:RCK N-terminal domain-containing protein n=1 Tax=Pseudomonas fluorescens TaxID=294 RepID=A0A2N1E248_PSEFL|nr:hypothetical protein CIB54_18075 [Pseudomonas fluorescens]